MTRKLGALGLALVAVFAMTAVAASSASATGEKFHCTGSANERCVLTATSEVNTKAEFTSGETAISCTAHARATSDEQTETSLTVLPEYTTGTCNLNSHVRVNHCDYDFASSTNATGHAQVTLNCAAGNVIELEITDLGCTLKFGSQTPNGGVHYTNVGGHVTVESTLTNITFTKEGGFGCIFIGTTGGYKGKDTVTCFEDAGSAPTAGTGGTTDTYSEGKEVTCKHE